MSLLFVSCSQKITRILPNGNLDKQKIYPDSVNTEANEIAPYQRNTEDNCGDAFYKEYSKNTFLTSEIVKPANKFMKEILGPKYPGKEKILTELTNKLESVSFLTRNSGLVALSHSPDSNYNKINNIYIFGNVGGTDLFTFNLESGNFVFRTLPEPINSIFWDSHPWIGQDSLCNYVLIWASDRNNPYSKTISQNGETLYKGNSDLFYSFRVNNKWSEPKLFDYSTKINTESFNEISPFVACMSISPKLLFSSNRDGDYDILGVDIKFDFSKQTIEVLSEPYKFEKGNQYDFQKQYINTDANEMFPFVKYPYITASKELYFTSDRNVVEKPINRTQDTMVINKGKFDLYKFNIDLECSVPTTEPPPKQDEEVVVRLTLIDKNGNKVHKPVIMVNNSTINDNQLYEQDELEITLKQNMEYTFYGGSLHNKVECDPNNDLMLQFYKGTSLVVNPPKIQRNEIKINYDSVTNPNIVVFYDTSYVTEIVPLSPDLLKSESTYNLQNTNNLKSVSTTSKVVDFKTIDCTPKNTKKPSDGLPNRIQDAPNQSNNKETFVEIKKMIVTKREVYEGGKIIKKTRVEYQYDTIPRIDTLYINVAGANIKSKLTQLHTLNTNRYNSKKILYDTVTLDPYYFEKPECLVEFINIESEYNKNVPFFQTAFWKVNTSNGLPEHLHSFQKGQFLEQAGYIELHPKHRKYGVAYKVARNQRLEEYKYYAKQVDGNLKVMSDVVTKEFISKLETIENYAPETKLLLKLEAYSDIRDASVCYYIGNTVEFMQGKEEPNGTISIENQTIRNNATLSNDNENLSKLRVFYGFNEIFERLKKNKKFSEYLRKGLVFYPTMKFNSIEERQNALSNAKIIILAEGKFYEKVVKDDEKDYDPIRRLNLVVKLIKFSAGRIVPSDCCK